MDNPFSIEQRCTAFNHTAKLLLEQLPSWAQDVWSISERHESADAIGEFRRLTTCSYSTTAFYGIPMTMTSDIVDLLGFYALNMAEYMYPTSIKMTCSPLKTYWFPSYLADKDLLYLCLFLSSSLRPGHSLSGGLRDPELFLYPLYAELNKRISHPETITDVTLDAIMTLGWVEAKNCNREGHDTHMRGLEQVIKLRGGHEALDPRIRNKILRMDLGSAAMQMTIPRYAFDQRHFEIEWPEAFENFYLPHRALPEGTNSVILEAFAKLHHFVAFLEYSSNDPTIEVDPWAFDEECMSLLYTFLCASGFRKASEKAYRLAAILYIGFLARPMFSTSTKFAGKIAERLGTEVRGISMSQNLHRKRHEDGYTSSLIWVLVVGAICCHHTPERPMFVAHLRRLAVQETLFSWDKVRPILRGIAWLAPSQDPWGQGLWAEVMDGLEQAPNEAV